MSSLALLILLLVLMLPSTFCLLPTRVYYHSKIKIKHTLARPSRLMGHSNKHSMGIINGNGLRTKRSFFHIPSRTSTTTTTTALSARAVYQDLISEQDQSLWFRISNSFLFHQLWDALANPSLYNGLSYGLIVLVVLASAGYARVAIAAQSIARLFRSKNEQEMIANAGNLAKESKKSSDGLEEYECEV